MLGSCGIQEERFQVIAHDLCLWYNYVVDRSANIDVDRAEVKGKMQDYGENAGYFVQEGGGKSTARETNARLQQTIIAISCPRSMPIDTRKQALNRENSWSNYDALGFRENRCLSVNTEEWLSNRGQRGLDNTRNQ
jgi:hypothetical protein